MVDLYTNTFLSSGKNVLCGDLNKKFNATWKSLNSIEKRAFLYFVSSSWSKNVAEMEKSLPHLKMIDWEVSADGVLPFWMHLFTGQEYPSVSRAVFDLYTPQGEQAWKVWWEHHSNTVSNVCATMGVWDANMDVKKWSMHSASARRTHTLMDFVSVLFSNWTRRRSLSDEILQQWSQLLIGVSNSQESIHGVHQQWNGMAAFISSHIAPLAILRPDALSPQALSWWKAQEDVFFVHKTSPGSGHQSLYGEGLTSRPEMIFNLITAQIYFEKFNNKGFMDEDYVKYEEAFLNSCEKRWNGLEPEQRVSPTFFLPSFYNAQSKTLAFIKDCFEGQKRFTMESHIERLALMSSTGLWPWVEQAPSKPQKKKM